jgi:hypothetical protein
MEMKTDNLTGETISSQDHSQEIHISDETGENVSEAGKNFTKRFTKPKELINFI